MELRAYWKIIWRRIWLIALLVGVVALYVGYELYHLHKTANALTTYGSNVTVQLSIQVKGEAPNIAATTSTAEAFADTLATGPLLSSQEFGTQVSHQIATDTASITQKFGSNADLGNWKNGGAVGSSITPTHIHSLVTLSISWSAPAGAWAIAHAAGQVLTANMGQYFNYMLASDTSSPVGQSVAIGRVLDDASDVASTPVSTSSKQVMLLLLLLVALIVGIALTFLLDYLDDRIRSKDEVNSLLQLPVYSEIPRAPAIGRTRSVTKTRSVA